MRNNARNVEDKGRTDRNSDKDERGKKKFDKKKYRLQKYSNKYKIAQWEEKRKKAVLRRFYKELKKDQQNSTETLNLSCTSKNEDKLSNNEFKKKSYAYFKAKREFQRKQQEEKKKKEDAIRKKAEREQAQKNYKEKKMRNFKVLSKKTRKGQPVMKGRIEMLLEKIQRTMT